MTLHMADGKDLVVKGEQATSQDTIIDVIGSNIELASGTYLDCAASLHNYRVTWNGQDATYQSKAYQPESTSIVIDDDLGIEGGQLTATNEKDGDVKKTLIYRPTQGEQVLVNVTTDPVADVEVSVNVEGIQGLTGAGKYEIAVTPEGERDEIGVLTLSNPYQRQRVRHRWGRPCELPPATIEQGRDRVGTECRICYWEVPNTL